MRQHQQEWSTVKKKQNTPPTQKEVVVVRPEPIYLPFASKHAHLTESVIPWAEAGAYFVFCDTGSTKRFFHIACSGKTNIRDEIPLFIEKHPVVVLDLSVYPMLMDDQEWVYAIVKVNPEYKACTCSFARYVLDEKACQYYRLEKPYFYLCNMNWLDDMGEKAILPHEEMIRRRGGK